MFPTRCSGNLVNGINGWGKPVAEYMEKYNRLAAVFITGEDPPQASNRVTLHPTERDQYGLAVPVVEYEMHPNSLAMQRHAIEQTTGLYESLDGTHIQASEGIFVTAHNMGAARMSERPKDGVTNRWGQTHDTPNLFVSDGSVFTSSAAANPTLTIVTLAIRQAEHIAERMRRREL